MKIKRILSMVLALVLCIGAMSITAFAAEETMYGIGFVAASSLRLRSEPNVNSATLVYAPRNDCVAVISKTGEWYKVNYNLQVGYMHQDYLKVLTRENAELGYGEVSGSGVNLRSGPSTTYGKVAVASSGEKCYILGLNNGWYKVIYNSSICYIRSDYLRLTEIPYENQASPNSPKFYRLGKSTGGFDCSGFVYYVLKQLGFSPYRTPADQYNQGTYVDKDSLQPGDIVFFAGTYASGISHVGIYVGGGQFIHSPNSRSTVSYSDLTSGYWAQHYYGARRMV